MQRQRCIYNHKYIAASDIVLIHMIILFIYLSNFVLFNILIEFVRFLQQSAYAILKVNLVCVGDQKLHGNNQPMACKWPVYFASGAN